MRVGTLTRGRTLPAMLPLCGEAVAGELERKEKNGGKNGHNSLAQPFYLVRNRFAKERQTTAMGLKVLTRRCDGLLRGVCLRGHYCLRDECLTLRGEASSHRRRGSRVTGNQRARKGCQEHQGIQILADRCADTLHFFRWKHGHDILAKQKLRRA